jgi:hypothetical protein
MKFKILMMAFLVQLNASPVLHQFALWGKSNEDQKLSLYWGWTNGFLAGRGKAGIALAHCLEALSYDQAIAMVDKQYKNFPEKWSRPFGDQVLEALTVAGGPCEGKNPLLQKSN